MALLFRSEIEFKWELLPCPGEMLLHVLETMYSLSVGTEQPGGFNREEFIFSSHCIS